jgi:hypothetical protein
MFGTRPPRVSITLRAPTRNGVRIMERYIHNENLRRYRWLLETEQDEEKRNVIRKLLAEEQAKVVPASRNDASQDIHKG